MTMEAYYNYVMSQYHHMIRDTDCAACAWRDQHPDECPPEAVCAMCDHPEARDMRDLVAAIATADDASPQDVPERPMPLLIY